jgi:uncharacterized protein YjiS (DUF1127 family)
MTDAPRQRLGLHLLSLNVAPLFALMREWARRTRSRRDISRLDECTIRDLGLTPSQLQFEARKPFWRA